VRVRTFVVDHDNEGEVLNECVRLVTSVVGVGIFVFERSRPEGVITRVNEIDRDEVMVPLFVRNPVKVLDMVLDMVRLSVALLDNVVVIEAVC